MNRPINLIPQFRIQARQRAVACRRWAQAGAVYLVLTVAACLTVQTLWVGSPRNLAAQLEQAQVRLDNTQTRLTRISSQLNATQQRVTSNHAVTNQPDWSVLLALLSGTLDDRVVLRGCRFQSMAPDASNIQTSAGPSAFNAGRPGGTPGGIAGRAGESFRGVGGFPVYATGFGQDLQAVSAYVLRLEATGLFDRVKLISTRGEPLPFGKDQRAIAFEIECFLTLSPPTDPGGGHE